MKISTNKKRIIISLLIFISLIIFITINKNAYIVDGKFNYMFLILSIIVIVESCAIFMLKIKFTNKVVNIFYTILAIILSVVFSYMIIELLNQNTLFSTSIKRLIFNFIIVILLHLFIYAISNRIRLTIILTNSILLILGIVNYTVICFRGTPLVPWDILSLKTAAYVASSYTFQFKFYFLLALCFYVFILSIASKVQCSFKKSWFNLVFRIICILLIIVLLLVFYKTDVINYFQFENNLWEPRLEYLNNGFLASFLKQSKNLFNTAPKNYSTETVESLLTDYESTNKNNVNEDSPNIIVIMNESYSDLTVNRRF